MFELVQEYDWEIGCIVEGFGFDIYFNQIEIILVEQMLDVYLLVGMLVGYNYWFYGKYFVFNEQYYCRG